MLKPLRGRAEVEPDLLALPGNPLDRAHRVRFGYGANANPKDHAAFEARGDESLRGLAILRSRAQAGIDAPAVTIGNDAAALRADRLEQRREFNSRVQAQVSQPALELADMMRSTWPVTLVSARA